MSGELCRKDDDLYMLEIRVANEQLHVQTLKIAKKSVCFVGLVKRLVGKKLSFTTIT